MDKAVSREVYRSFRSSADFFEGLEPETIGAVLAAGADITLFLSPKGGVLDVAYRDKSFKAWGVDHWVGRDFRDTVTVEGREKVKELLQEAATVPLTRSRQVSHPADGGRDLPVGYRVISAAGRDRLIAVGTDMRSLAEMQQRLVRAQVDMEKDYRKIRDMESRYRILFHLAFEPLLVVDGKSHKIIDANEGAARLLDRPAKRLAGSTVLGCFARADQALVSETLTAILHRGREDDVEARLAGLDQPVRLRVTPFREFGTTNLLVRLVADGRSGVGIHAMSGILSVARSLPDALVAVDESGAVTEANAAFLDLVRIVSLDRVEGRPLDTWLGATGVDLQVLLANLREHGSVRRFSTVVRDELGSEVPVEVSATAVAGPEGRTYGFSIRESLRQDAPVARISGNPAETASQFTDLVGRVPLKDLVRDTADIIEKLCIEAALRLTDNNRASAADMLGLSRQSLYIKLRRYGIADSTEANEPD
jgi:transcriptional regulator PpsR